ncbi:MAG: preprotein translocase subunit YajC [Acidimicrobiia bacterium]
MIFVTFGQETTGSGLTSLIFLAAMIGIFYFLLIRPQRKRAKAQQELAASIKAGDEVRTVGGIHGTVISADDDSIVLRVEEGKIRVSRRAIGTRVGDSE